MKLHDLKMRIVGESGMPFGLRLAISLTTDEMTSLKAVITPMESRMGVTLNEAGQLIIAPGNSAATVEQVAKHIDHLVNRQNALLTPALAENLLILSSQLKAFSNQNPLSLGKSRETANAYQNRVDSECHKFCNKFYNQHYSKSDYDMGISLYKNGKDLAGAKSCLEAFVEGTQYLTEKERKAFNQSVEPTRKGDAFATAQSLISNIDKLMEMKQDHLKSATPEPSTHRLRGA